MADSEADVESIPLSDAAMQSHDGAPDSHLDAESDVESRAPPTMENPEVVEPGPLTLPVLGEIGSGPMLFVLFDQGPSSILCATRQINLLGFVKAVSEAISRLAR